MKHIAYRKVMKVIHSCKTICHFKGAKKMIGYFKIKYGDSNLLESLKKSYSNKKGN